MPSARSGLYERETLVYCGNVGTGFDVTTIRSRLTKLEPLGTKSSAFEHPPKTRTAARWVRPELVAQVRFTKWTNDESMRHPVFLGLRDDKSPHDCHRERSVPNAVPNVR